MRPDKAATPVPDPVADTVGYCRVSTEEQATDVRTSVRDQHRAIQALAERLGRSVGHLFEDLGVSGATAEGRPGFMALVTHCRTHLRSLRAPGYVLVLNDSRWGRFRDPEEATYWRVELKRHGWLVRFAEGDETDDPLARGVLRTIHSAQATAFREAIRANAKRGARGTAAQGFWQNEAPIGYRRQTEAPGRAPRVLEPGQRKSDDEKVRLVPGPAEEVRLVRELFDRYASGTASLGGLARELRRTTPARRWSKQGVQRILTNRAYLGEVIWCRRPHDALERAEHRVRPRDEWVVVENAHPPLVTEELFARVQRRLGQNRRELRRTAGGYALSGLLRCAACEEPYVGAGGPKGPPDDPDRYRFYRCRGQRDGSREVWTCTGPSGILPRRLIEPEVVEVVGQVVRDPGVTRAITDALDAALSHGRQHAGEVRADVERKRRSLTAERDRLVRAIAKGLLSEEEARGQLSTLRTELEALSIQADQTRFDEQRARALDSERERLLALATNFPALARRLHGLELRELLRPWVQNAEVDLAHRQVRVTIRRVPAAGLLLVSSATPAPD